MTLCFKPDQIVSLNKALTGDAHLLVHPKRLEGALGRPMHTFDGYTPYPTVHARAGALLHGLLSAHPFLDGNKRTAWLASVMYLDLHGIVLQDVPALEAEAFVLGVVENKFDERAAGLWFVRKTTDHASRHGTRKYGPRW